MNLLSAGTVLISKALFFLVFFTFCAASAQPEYYGYLDKLEAEDLEYAEFIVNQQKPASLNPDYVFFDNKLVRSLERRYEDIFGYSSAQRNLQLSKFDESLILQRSNKREIEDIHARQNKFATFMLRKFTEKQIDSYLKNDPELKKVYQAKERLSKYEVKTKKGWKFAAKYSIAGNFTRLQYSKNGTKLFYLYEGDNGEQTLAVKQALSKKLAVASHINLYKKSVQMILDRALTAKLSLGFSSTIYEQENFDRDWSNTHIASLSYVWN